MNKFIKTNWKNILLFVFIIFSLNRCTVACNRSYQIDKAEHKVEVLDSMIQDQSKKIFNLQRDVIEYKNRLGLYDRFSKEREKQDSINNKRQQEQIEVIRKLRNK